MPLGKRIFLLLIIFITSLPIVFMSGCKNMDSTMPTPSVPVKNTTSTNQGRIAFVSIIDGSTSIIYTMNPDGSNLAQ